MILLLLYLPRLLAYPYKFSCNSGVSTTSIAHGTALQNGSAYSVIVKRGTTTLASGASYVSGETLSVSLSPPPGSDQYLIQVTNAVVQSGSCSNKRFENKGGSIIMPSDNKEVTIIAATAPSRSTVTITSSFTLKVGTAIPISTPSFSPTPKPTDVGETNPPSHKPTLQPTAVPSTTGLHVTGFNIQVSFRFPSLSFSIRYSLLCTANCCPLFSLLSYPFTTVISYLPAYLHSLSSPLVWDAESPLQTS